MWYSQMIFRKNNFVFFPSNHHVPKSNFDCFPPIKLPQIFSYFAALFSCCWCLITCYCYFCYKVIVYENKVTCIFLKSINSKNYLKNIFTITVLFPWVGCSIFNLPIHIFLRNWLLLRSSHLDYIYKLPNLCIQKKTLSIGILNKVRVGGLTSVVHFFDKGV